jgi:hypothetical protein
LSPFFYQNLLGAAAPDYDVRTDHYDASNTTNDNDPEYSLWGARFNTKRSKDTWTFGYK